MTTVHPDGSGTALSATDAEAAVALAERAPSIHNTQPWRWELRRDGLVLLADRSRQLRVADPDGHSLMISCGAALHLTAVALRAAGWQVEVQRETPTSHSEVLALFRARDRNQPQPEDVARADAARRRRSDRRPFRPEPVPEDVREGLRETGTIRGVNVDFPVRDDQRVDLAVAVSWADQVERDDEAYRAEMLYWLRDSDVHDDGVIPSAVPRVAEGHPRRTDVPLRDFELGMPGQQLIEQDVDEKPLIAVLFTDSDTAPEQLAAGEALMALMLEAEVRGLASCPMSQAVDLAAFRTRLQSAMGWVGHPQMLVRLGYPSAVPHEGPHTPRRPVEDVLTVV